MRKSLSDLTNRRELGAWLNRNGLANFGVEVGVAYGENAERILQSWRGRTLFLVDPWKKWGADEYVDGTSGMDFDGCFNYMVGKLSRFVGRTSIIRETSVRAAEIFRAHGMKFDFVYLDANHHDPHITNDILAWWELMLPGGLLGGHDYYDCDQPASGNKARYKCEVKTVVDRFAEARGLELHTTSGDSNDASWWIIKP